MKKLNISKKAGKQLYNGIITKVYENNLYDVTISGRLFPYKKIKSQYKFLVNDCVLVGFYDADPQKPFILGRSRNYDGGDEITEENLNETKIPMKYYYFNFGRTNWAKGNRGRHGYIGLRDGTTPCSQFKESSVFYEFPEFPREDFESIEDYKSYFPEEPGFFDYKTFTGNFSLLYGNKKVYNFPDIIEKKDFSDNNNFCYYLKSLAELDDSNHYLIGIFNHIRYFLNTSSPSPAYEFTFEKHNLLNRNYDEKIFESGIPEQGSHDPYVYSHTGGQCYAHPYDFFSRSDLIKEYKTGISIWISRAASGNYFNGFEWEWIEGGTSQQVWKTFKICPRAYPWSDFVTENIKGKCIEVGMFGIPEGWKSGDPIPSYPWLETWNGGFHSYPRFVNELKKSIDFITLTYTRQIFDPPSAPDQWQEFETYYQISTDSGTKKTVYYHKNRQLTVSPGTWEEMVEWGVIPYFKEKLQMGNQLIYSTPYDNPTKVSKSNPPYESTYYELGLGYALYTGTSPRCSNNDYRFAYNPSDFFFSWGFFVYHVLDWKFEIITPGIVLLPFTSNNLQLPGVNDFNKIFITDDNCVYVYYEDLDRLKLGILGIDLFYGKIIYHYERDIYNVDGIYYLPNVQKLWCYGDKIAFNAGNKWIIVQ